jgi:hypothetical protein
MTDGDGIESSGQHAGPFALVFLGTDSTRDGRQHIVLTQFGGCRKVVSFANQIDNFSDLNTDRTTVRAFRVRASQATLRFPLCDRFLQTQVNLFEVMGTLAGVLFGHLLARNFGAFLRWKLIDHGLYPRGALRWMCDIGGATKAAPNAAA